MKPLRFYVGALLGLLPLATAAQSPSLPGPLKLAVSLQAEPFPLRQVRLLDGPFRDALLRDERYLLSLDPERLLHMFRVTAGLPSSAKAYGGWEAPQVEVRGHSLGHYLTACSLMYAATDNAVLKARVDAIVAALAQCQEASLKQGFHAGYLSAYPESFIDRVESGQPVWAPWYTLHKIYAGLLDAYQSCGNRQALDVLVKAADWVKFRVDRLGEARLQAALRNEFGGMNEVLANLYAVTGQPDHLRLAKAFDHRLVFDPLARGEDRLNGLHANTQIPKIIGAAREYELTGETPYRDIAKFFWQRVAINRAYVIGGHSDREHFFPIEQFSQHLGPETAETCNTYNLLKLTRHLFSWEPSAKTMDYYERALFNHILASQDPVKGMFVYLMSLKPGHFKTYSLPEDSFWCCVGTGMENHAKYGDSIYSHTGENLYVNQYIASELRWPEAGCTVRQETRFPEADSTRLTFQVERPAVRTVWFRHPAWATDGVSVRINGERHPLQSVPGSYVPVLREWRTGDRLELQFPMRPHWESMPDAPSVVAFLYGPVVLAARLGAEGMPSPYAKVQTEQVGAPSPEVPVLTGTPEEMLRRIKPKKGTPLAFELAATASSPAYSLVPFHLLHHERYTVYWTVLSPEAYQSRKAALAAAEARRQELERRTVDRVGVGHPQSETDHRLQGERTEAGDWGERKWRHARDGGWFSYQLKVPTDAPAELQCTFWGSDAGGRTFEIWVEDRKLATLTLERNRPEEFFDVHYPLPAEAIRGKSQVAVRFQALPGKMAGGLFGCAVLKSAAQP